MVKCCPNRHIDLIPMSHMQDDFGEYWECPRCHYQEDIEPEEREAEISSLKAQITAITNLLRRVDEADYMLPDGVLRAIIEGDYADATAIMDEYEAALAQVKTHGYMKGSE